MGFKLKAPYNIDWTPVYRTGEDGANGSTTNGGAIVINKNITCPKQYINTLSHEMVHVDQLKRGDMVYNKKYFYWKGNIYNRGKNIDGKKSLPWEKEAYNKEIKI